MVVKFKKERYQQGWKLREGRVPGFGAPRAAAQGLVQEGLSDEIAELGADAEFEITDKGHGLFQGAPRALASKPHTGNSCGKHSPYHARFAFNLLVHFVKAMGFRSETHVLATLCPCLCSYLNLSVWPFLHGQALWWSEARSWR